MAPGPPRPPIHRQPALLMQMFSEPQPVLDRLRAEYGPVVGLGVGPLKMAIVGGPAEVRSLLTRPVEDFRWNHKFNALAVVVGKESMITSDGDDWARRRASVQSAFSRRRLNGWIPMILARADAAIDALPAEGSHDIDDCVPGCGVGPCDSVFQLRGAAGSDGSGWSGSRTAATDAAAM